MHHTSKVVKPQSSGEDDLPRRIAVIGRAGAGKTTVALRLGEVFGLPVVHLDRLAWEPGWRPADVPDFDVRHAAAIAGERWVIDGGYLGRAGWLDRVRRADVVVLVEAPLAVCLGRIVRRGLRPVRRPDLPDGCEDALSASFVFWTVTWSWRTRNALAPLRRGDPGMPPLVRVRLGDDPVVAMSGVAAGPEPRARRPSPDPSPAGGSR